jgi:carbon storage regulator CsrA
MLVLSRKKNESIVINNDITVTVVENTKPADSSAGRTA